MFSPQHFSSLVGDIYDCVAEPARWTSVLGQLTSQFNGLIATMSVMDTAHQKARFAATFGDEALITPLVTTYAQDMPFYHVIPRMEIDVPVTLDTIYEFAGPGAEDRMKDSRLGREWLVPNNVGNCICIALLKQAQSVGTLVITTTRDRPPILRSELDAFSLIAPHIRRAVTIGDLFETRKSEADVYRDILNLLATPLFIISADLRIIFANASAEDLLRQGTRVMSIAGKLTLGDALAQNCISRAVQLAEQSEFALGSMGIGIPAGGKRDLSRAHVLPLTRRASAGRLDDRAAAAIFFSSPGGDPIPAVDALAALFGLTPAEKRVAMQIAGGSTRADIAAANGVADATVKSQLDAIYAKTETGNQRQLQNLIRDLSPILRRQ